MRLSILLRATALLLAICLAPSGARAQRRGPYPDSGGGTRDGSAPTLAFTLVKELELPAPPTGPPLPAGEGWIVGCEAGVLAYSDGGERLWTREDLTGARISPVLTRDAELRGRLLWVASDAGGGRLEALRVRDGRSLFSTALSAPPLTPPVPRLPLEVEAAGRGGAVSPDEVLVLLEDGTVRAFAADLGKELWSTAVRDAAPHPPLPLAPGVALVTRVPGSLELVGRGVSASRPLLVIGDHPSPLAFDPQATRKKRRAFFVAGRDGRLRSLRCKLKKGGPRCKERWLFRTGARVEAAPVVLSDRVLVTSWDNGLYSLARRSGHLRWKTLASHRVGLTPVVGGLIVFLAPRTASAVQAFHLADGAAAGAYDAGGRDEIPREPGLRGRILGLLLSAPPRAGTDPEDQGRHRLRLLSLSEADQSAPATGGQEAGAAPREGAEGGGRP